ncbi:MAG: Calx-beta domain-containing protein, partial [Trebonia sp.]
MINAPVPQTQELLAGQPGVFDVTRDAPTDSPLMVNYTLSGTATNGTDYDTLSGTVTIPAGSADATIDVDPLDDGDGDDGAAGQSVIATLTSTSGDYEIDPDASSATVNIAEEDPPTVTISAPVPNAVENDPNNEGEYVVARTGSTDEPLTVNLAASGTAVPGTNYDALPSSVTIPAGSQTAVLQVSALDDSADGNGPETVTETIQPGNYTIGSPNSADVSILEQPTSTVTIAATTPSTMEDSTTPGEFTVTRTAPYDNDLAVSYSLSGTAVNGLDYQTLGGSVTIPAGAPDVVFDVTPLDDGGDGSESAGGSAVTATIAPDANLSYFVGNGNSASVSIAEEPLPQVW